MAAMALTLNDLEGHSPVADVSKCNLSNTCAAFYMISNDSVLAWFLCISRASCFTCNHGTKPIQKTNDIKNTNDYATENKLCDVPTEIILPKIVSK